MLFNSLDFAVFFPVVFILYWFVFNKNRKYQNLFIAIASYVFYGWWDWRFLILIVLSSLIDFVVGIQLGKTTIQRKKNLLIILSLTFNLGMLFFFKYFNFFIDSFNDAFTLFGSKLNLSTLKIILPVGISFYTFQTLSYSIDVYKGKMKPTKNMVAFFAYVAFFPQLVAGPIERAVNLLPQFQKDRVFNKEKAINGMLMIIWGLFKKVAIADNLSPLVDKCFSHPEIYGSLSLILGVVFFAFQIYCDFSGYSDIAIGSAALLGFRLMKNFNYPYFSRDIAEFWRRWHISLSTWFRDYLYIPLGGSRGSELSKVKNIFIIFLVSGFWHGANWTFIVWGGLNAIYFLPLMLAKQNRTHLEIVAGNSIFPSFRELLLVAVTFTLTCFAWIFFRADSVQNAFGYITEIAGNTGIDFSLSYSSIVKSIFLISLLLSFEWFNRKRDFGLSIRNLPRVIQLVFVVFVIDVIVLFGNFGYNEFIYFQF